MDCVIYHTQFGWLSTASACLTTILLEHVYGFTHFWKFILLPRFLVLFCMPNPLLRSSVHCYNILKNHDKTRSLFSFFRKIAWKLSGTTCDYRITRSLWMLPTLLWLIICVGVHMDSQGLQSLQSCLCERFVWPETPFLKVTCSECLNRSMGNMA